MDTENQNKFGNAVREARVQSHITQEALAEILNISTTHLKTIERGRRNPSFTLLEKMVKTLNISLDALFLDNNSQEEELISELEIMLRKCDKYQLTMLRYMINGLLQEKSEK